MPQMLNAIKTDYKGIQFRSKLEAQWAKFLDSISMRWVYEPETFKFSDGTLYMPDFFLPDSKQWFEVKGVMTEKDKHKIEMLCKESGYDVIIGYSNGEFEMCDTRLIYVPLAWYSKGETYINRCEVCGKLSFMNSIGRWDCQCCGAYDGDGYIDWIMVGDSSYSQYEEITTSEWLRRATIDVRQEAQQPSIDTEVERAKNWMVRRDDRIALEYELKETKLNDRVLAFAEAYKEKDFLYGGNENLCDLDTIKKYWSMFDPSNRPPCMEIRDYFRDRKIEKIFEMKSKGATPEDIARTGISYRMIHQWYDNKEKAEQFVKHPL